MCGALSMSPFFDNCSARVLLHLLQLYQHFLQSAIKTTTTQALSQGQSALE